MRIEYIAMGRVKSRSQVWRICPWAIGILDAVEGWMAYEDINDYYAAKRSQEAIEREAEQSRIQAARRDAIDAEVAKVEAMIRKATKPQAQAKEDAKQAARARHREIERAYRTRNALPTTIHDAP